MSYTVAVRALCEFTAKRGDLDLRFTPTPTALDGIAGHQLVAARRAADYEREISLSGSHGELLVRGRADGYDPQQNRLEEVKTYRARLGHTVGGDPDVTPGNHRALHWAQAMVYGHMLCEQRKLDTLRVALIYFEIGSLQESVLERELSAKQLATCFAEHCVAFLEWAIWEQSHRAERDAALAALRFPHSVFRAGQRELSVAVYRAARAGACVMAQAPTGIGKTLGTIFPLLKACPVEKIDKVFFLTAKSSGHALALDAIASLIHPTPIDQTTDSSNCGAPLPLRVLQLTARDKACEHRDKACHGDSCPLARGFYDRLPAARATALRAVKLDQLTVREVGLAHQICPYYLAAELTRWSDVVVGDYNYYFDSSAMLYALTQANQWRVAVLVDEAHNLLDRAREMYTARFDQISLRAARVGAPRHLLRAFDVVERHCNELARQQTNSYEVLAAPPKPLLDALQQLLSAMTEYLVEVVPGTDSALMRCYFDLLNFSRLMDQFGTHSLFDVSLHQPGLNALRELESRQPRSRQPQSPQPQAPQLKSHLSLCLRNVIPASFLAPRHAGAHVTVLFSGTLGPHHFYRDTLGLPATTEWIEVGAPFKAEQLRVRLVTTVSTRLQHREASLQPIVELMASTYRQRPGNYLSFFSSFAYLERVLARMTLDCPEVPTWAQMAGMTDLERSHFLARFSPQGCGIGFAVLGGAFGEGIDLPGARLIGAFVATLGLPQMNQVNEEMRRVMQARFGDGYNYVYLYPGMRRVVQAAGRVIRSETDTGTLHLIDDRYGRVDVQALLPDWWQLTV